MAIAIRLSLAAFFAAGATAVAQSGLYAIDYSGNLIHLNTTTGAGTLVGATGFAATNSAAADSLGRIFTVGGNPDQLILVNAATAASTVFLNLASRPFGYGVRGLAFDPQDHLYAVLSQADVTTPDLLATIDMNTGAYTVVGSTGRPDIQGLACNAAGVLYAVGVNSGLYTLDSSTGAASLIGGSFQGDDQSLEFDDHGVLYACRANLRTVDPATGATTLIGPTGFSDIRGTAFVRGPAQCYANCDGSTVAPVLNINDFVCFLTSFASGASYANCDGSTTPPVLNVNDCVCFMSRFAAGCL
jgi:hypothetical protein